jgi:formimidoylglutamate deiminase
MNEFRFKGLLQNNGWIDDVTIETDTKGIIKSITSGVKGKSTYNGYALPGFQNAHSHAFQYAMSGLAELHSTSPNQNDFWSWRKSMYALALKISPDQMESISASLYKEMLRNGYTHVAEFHYVHHDSKGNFFSNRSEMGERLIAGAKKAGIKITLVPIFYQNGGFGKKAEKEQCRFISETYHEYMTLVEASKKSASYHSNAMIGMGIHSLRAVDADNIIRLSREKKQTTPFHIHVSEQLKEIEECEAFLNQRPVDWLSSHVKMDENFHLVHATHLIEKEVKQIAASNANVVLCPSTEGNLGDGLFPLNSFLKQKGRWSIGTDSHIGINPLEEIRILDYGQRLVTHNRNTFGNEKTGDNGHITIGTALINGRKSMGIDQSNYFEVGQPLDALVISESHPLIASTSSKNRCNTIIYAGDTSMFKGTIVNGKWVIESGIHEDSEIDDHFLKTLNQLKVR